MNIFVGSLPFSVEESRLQELFEEFGEVNSVKIISDKFSGRSKGFGFVEMPDDEQAKNAINELNGSDLEGRKIVVNQAEERKPDNRRGGFGGDDRRGGYNKGGGGGRGGYGNRGGGGGGYRSSY
ncbi:MAG: RNA recognition motif domain-containing protein [Bacteroidales bacterium]